jgi:hypothetical protein
MNKTLKHNLPLVGLAGFVLIVVVAVVMIFSPRNVLSGPPGETTQNHVPLAGLELPLTDLQGQWSVKENDTSFVGTVVGNDIKIEMLAGDGASALYWHGTFKTSESPGSVVTSTKTEGHDEIVISQSQTKDFTIGQNSITFKFSALGFSKNLEMRR